MVIGLRGGGWSFVVIGLRESERITEVPHELVETMWASKSA